MVFVDLTKAVSEAFILVRIDALHLSFDYINRVISHAGAETCEGTGEQIDGYLIRDDFAQLLLCVLKHDESHALI